MKAVILIIILILSGCASSRKRNSEEYIISSLDRISDRADSVTRNMYHYSVKKESVTGELVVRSTETKFSAPDSSGNQHIISRTETESTYKETSDANTDVYNEDKMQSGSRIRDSTNLNIVYSEEVEKETRRPAVLIWIIISSVVAFLAYIIYRFIKKKDNGYSNRNRH